MVHCELIDSTVAYYKWQIGMKEVHNLIRGTYEHHEDSRWWMNHVLKYSVERFIIEDNYTHSHAAKLMSHHSPDNSGCRCISYQYGSRTKEVSFMRSQDC